MKMIPYLFVIVKNPTVKATEETGAGPQVLYPTTEGGAGVVAFVLATGEQDALVKAGAFIPAAERGSPLVEIHVCPFG